MTGPEKPVAERDTDPSLVAALRSLGDRYGPLGVALTAVELSASVPEHAETVAHQVAIRLGVATRAEPTEQDAPINWEAIARQREHELRAVGEALTRAEATITRVKVARGIHAVAHPYAIGGCAACHMAAALAQPTGTL